MRPEGCLSVPRGPRQIVRPASVTVEWLALDGEPMSGRFTGLSAACVQHEIEHMDGITIANRTQVP